MPNRREKRPCAPRERVGPVFRQIEPGSPASILRPAASADFSGLARCMKLAWAAVFPAKLAVAGPSRRILGKM